MVRYLLAFLFAVIGGLTGPVIADAIDAEGLAAYGLFLAGAIIPCSIATALTVNHSLRGGRSRRITDAGR